MGKKDFLKICPRLSTSQCKDVLRPSDTCSLSRVLNSKTSASLAQNGAQLRPLAPMARAHSFQSTLTIMENSSPRVLLSLKCSLSSTATAQTLQARLTRLSGSTPQLSTLSKSQSATLL